MPFSRCCTHRFKLFPDPFAVVKEIKCIDKCSVRYEKEKGKSKGNEYFYGENTWQEADMAEYFFKRHAGNDGRILLHAYERAKCGQKKFICSIMHADLNLIHDFYIGQATYLNCSGQILMLAQPSNNVVAPNFSYHIV